MTRRNGPILRAAKRRLQGHLQCVHLSIHIGAAPGDIMLLRPSNQRGIGHHLDRCRTFKVHRTPKPGIEILSPLNTDTKPTA